MLIGVSECGNGLILKRFLLFQKFVEFLQDGQQDAAQQVVQALVVAEKCRVADLGASRYSRDADIIIAALRHETAEGIGQFLPGTSRFRIHRAFGWRRHSALIDGRNICKVVRIARAVRIIGAFDDEIAVHGCDLLGRVLIDFVGVKANHAVGNIKRVFGGHRNRRLHLRTLFAAGFHELCKFGRDNLARRFRRGQVSVYAIQFMLLFNAAVQSHRFVV